MYIPDVVDLRLNPNGHLCEQFQYFCQILFFRLLYRFFCEVTCEPKESPRGIVPTYYLKNIRSIHSLFNPICKQTGTRRYTTDTNTILSREKYANTCPMGKTILTYLCISLINMCFGHSARLSSDSEFPLAVEITSKACTPQLLPLSMLAGYCPSAPVKLKTECINRYGRGDSK